MHIHSSQTSFNTVNPYSAAAEKAVAAQRATAVRKKLMKKASGISEQTSPVETFLLGQWMAPQHAQQLGEDEYRSATPGKDSDSV